LAVILVSSLSLIGVFALSLSEDLLDRYFEYLGYMVERVFNFTDVVRGFEKN